ERTAAAAPEKTAAKLANDILFRSVRHSLQNRAVEIGAIKCRGQNSPIAVVQSRRLKCVRDFVIPAFFDQASEILNRREQKQNRTGRIAHAWRAADNLAGELAFVIDEKLRIQTHADAAKIDMVEIRAERESLQRTPPSSWSNDCAVCPFVGGLGLKIGITADALLDLRWRVRTERIVHGRETLRCSRK